MEQATTHILYSLLCSIGIIISIILLVSYLEKQKIEEEEERRKTIISWNEDWTGKYVEFLFDKPDHLPNQKYFLVEKDLDYTSEMAGLIELFIDDKKYYKEDLRLLSKSETERIFKSVKQ